MGLLEQVVTLYSVPLPLLGVVRVVRTILPVVMAVLVEARVKLMVRVLDQVTPHQHPRLKVTMVVLRKVLVVRIPVVAVAVLVRLEETLVVLLLVLEEQGVQTITKLESARLMLVVVEEVFIMVVRFPVEQPVPVVPVAVVLVDGEQPGLAEQLVLVAVEEAEVTTEVHHSIKMESRVVRVLLLSAMQRMSLRLLPI
jgi:hypothetical protein